MIATNFTSHAAWVVQDEDGVVLGIDHESGGYPWKPITFTNWQLWSSKAEGSRYAERFRNKCGFGHLRVVTVESALGLEPRHG